MSCQIGQKKLECKSLLLEVNLTGVEDLIVKEVIINCQKKNEYYIIIFQRHPRKSSYNIIYFIMIMVHICCLMLLSLIYTCGVPVELARTFAPNHARLLAVDPTLLGLSLRHLKSACCFSENYFNAIYIISVLIKRNFGSGTRMVLPL